MAKSTLEEMDRVVSLVSEQHQERRTVQDEDATASEMPILSLESRSMSKSFTARYSQQMPLLIFAKMMLHKKTESLQLLNCPTPIYSTRSCCLY